MNTEQRSQQTRERGQQHTESQEKQTSHIDSQLDSLDTKIQVQWESDQLQDDVQQTVKEQTETVENGESTLTFELLENTETKRRLLGIIASDSFKELIPQGQVDSPERRLDLLFQRINGLINTYIERQFNFNKEQMDACPVLKKSLIPAIEWYLLDMLKWEADKNWDTWGNEANNTALDLFNNAKFKDIKGIWDCISKFASWSQYLYGKLASLQKAIDFLTIHKDILDHADCYEQLADPSKCLNDFLLNPIWSAPETDNLFPHSDPNNNNAPTEVTPRDVGLILRSEPQTIWMTDDEKTDLITNIGNIEVVENERTTKNVVKALEKAEQFMTMTSSVKWKLQETLDRLDGPLSILEQFWLGIDTLPTDGLTGGIMNFILSAMGVPFGVEGLQRERALANRTYHTPEIVEDEIDDAGENGWGTWTWSTWWSGGWTWGWTTPSSDSEQIDIWWINIKPYQSEMEQHMSSPEINAFTQKLAEVTEKFKPVPYQRILHLIHKTSWFDPKHQEWTGDEGTTGIFNLPNRVIIDTLKSTPEEFAKKSAADQLAMFETMFSDEKWKIKEYADLALLNFNPEAFKEKDNENYVVCTSPVEMTVKDFKDLINDKFKKEVPEGTPRSIT